MKTTRAAVLAASALLLASSATVEASFHLWKMTEIYSNADGTVQFLEFAVPFDGEQFVAGHTLSSTVGGTTRTFTFPDNLPQGTFNKTFLIGTEGFAALGLVAPDFVVQNGFFSAGGGTANFSDLDVWNYPALPTSGGKSLSRDGATATNSPMNFAGQTAALPSKAGNFQALWWRSPAASESGWGLNITHQGNVLFATWFTYDQDGSGMWLVIPDAEKTGENAYSGKLYRTTGPAFDSATFNPAQVGVTELGVGSFMFADENNGTFSYAVSGVTQSKSITRQIYGSPVADCTSGGVAGARPSYQDLWWRSPAGSESGWGVNVTHQGDVLFATWFTYGADGKGLWLVMSNGVKTGPTTYSGPLYRTRGPAFNATPWLSSEVTVTEVGVATFNFPDAASGTFAYTVNGVSQSKPITRQVYGPITTCN